MSAGGRGVFFWGGGVGETECGGSGPGALGAVGPGCPCAVGGVAGRWHVDERVCPFPSWPVHRPMHHAPVQPLVPCAEFPFGTSTCPFVSVHLTSLVVNPPSQPGISTCPFITWSK